MLHHSWNSNTRIYGLISALLRNQMELYKQWVVNKRTSVITYDYGLFIKVSSFQLGFISCSKETSKRNKCLSKSFSTHCFPLSPWAEMARQEAARKCCPISSHPASSQMKRSLIISISSLFGTSCMEQQIQVWRYY